VGTVGDDEELDGEDDEDDEIGNPGELDELEGMELPFQLLERQSNTVARPDERKNRRFRNAMAFWLKR
jgi:hypothetical protein